MNAPICCVRRATLEDLPQLTSLWSTMRFPSEELAKRVTEFQVALAPEGVVLGAVGLQIIERQGRIHSEAFKDFALADTLRPLLWERLQSVANNIGLLRLWTRETAPFWSHCGLIRADGAVIQTLPAAWVNEGGGWLTLKLREDVDAVLALEKEFAMFMQVERRKTERTIEQAKILKFLATALAFLVVVLALAAAFYLVQRNPNLLRR